MRILITRPLGDARPLATRLGDLGHQVVIEPMLTIRPLPGPPLDLAGVQAVLLTSANGARALASRTPARGIPVFAVGDATAAAAHRLGFSKVKSADGDVAALAAVVAADLDPGAGRLCHVTGNHVAGDLAAILGARQFTIGRAQLYEAHASSRLSPGFMSEFPDHGIDIALFHSPRSARIFVDLAVTAGIQGDFGATSALCLSPAVAAPAAEMPWRRLRVAPIPSQNALLRLIGDGA